MKKPLVSIIVRTKNEERWITYCLKSIKNQSYKNFEIIIVDNNSTDKTVEKARQQKVKKIINIDKYLPGKALNYGIKYSGGEYIVCLSAHCIPKDSKWLENLVLSIKKNKKFAGVYGRQEPMSFSPAQDKRDMLVAFGLDEKIQKKDSFFHNANSIIKKKLWNKIPFDEKVTNIEDRLWAQKILNLGYYIHYTPNSSVYHYHGINQDNNKRRLKNVVNIIEKSNDSLISKGKLNAKKLNIIAVIPIKGASKIVGGKFLLEYTIKLIKKSKYIKRIFVSTDNKKTIKIAKKLGAECPFFRPLKLSKEKINLEEVQKFSLSKIEELGCFPDIFVHLEETYPFRSSHLVDGMIEHLLEDGYDTVIAAKSEYSWLWHEYNDKEFSRIDSGDMPRKFKKKSLIGLHGLGCVTYPEFVRKGSLIGKKTGLFETNHPLSNFEVRNEKSFKIAQLLLKNIQYS